MEGMGNVLEFRQQAIFIRSFVDPIQAQRVSGTISRISAQSSARRGVAIDRGLRHSAGSRA